MIDPEDPEDVDWRAEWLALWSAVREVMTLEDAAHMRGLSRMGCRRLESLAMRQDDPPPPDAGPQGA